MYAKVYSVFMNERLFIGDPHIHTDRATSGEYLLYSPEDVTHAMYQFGLDFAFTTSHTELPVETYQDAVSYNQTFYGVENGHDKLIHPSIEYTLKAGRSKFHAALIPHRESDFVEIPREMSLAELESFIDANSWFSSFLYHAGLSSYMSNTHEEDIATVLESGAIHGMEVFNGVLMLDDHPVERSSRPLHVLEQVESVSSKELVYVGGSDARFLKEAEREIGGVTMEVRAEALAHIPQALSKKGATKVVVDPTKYSSEKLDTLRRQAPVIDDYVVFRSSI